MGHKSTEQSFDCALTRSGPRNRVSQIPPEGLSLQAVERKCTLDPSKIEIVDAKNFEIAQLIAQAEFVIGLQLVAVAGSADALKIFAAVWIARFKPPNEPRRNNVVDVAADLGSFEIYRAGRNLTIRA